MNPSTEAKKKRRTYVALAMACFLSIITCAVSFMLILRDPGDAFTPPDFNPLASSCAECFHTTCICHELVTIGNLRYHVIDNTHAVLLGFAPGITSGNVTINPTAGDRPVTIIADGAFDTQSVGTLTLGTNIQTIGTNAFRNSGISSAELIIPSSVRTIRAGAFMGNPNLLTLRVQRELARHGSITQLENTSAFFTAAGSNATHLTAITVPEGSLSSYQTAWGTLYSSRMQATLTITEPTSGYIYKVLSPTQAVLSGLNPSVAGPRDIIVPQTVTLPGVDGAVPVVRIDAGAFENDSRIINLSFAPGSQITHIGSNAFAHSGLTGNFPMLPASVTHIEDSAFNQTNFTGSLIIPSNVTHIGHNAFFAAGFAPAGSPSSLNIQGNVGSEPLTIGDMAFGHTRFTSTLTLPDRVTSIGSWAFRRVAFTGTLTFGTRLQTIGRGAFAETTFSGTSATADDGLAVTGALVIPQSVTHIGAEAFYNIPGINNLVLRRWRSDLTGDQRFTNLDNSNAFRRTNGTVYITTTHVPAGSFFAYNNAVGWRDLNVQGALLTIEYRANGGTGTPIGPSGPAVRRTGNSISLLPNTFTAPLNYEHAKPRPANPTAPFVWNTRPDGSGISYDPNTPYLVTNLWEVSGAEYIPHSPVHIDKILVLYAVWDEIPARTIHYENVDDVAPSQLVPSYVTQIAVLNSLPTGGIALPNITRPGHTFLGWFITESGDDPRITHITEFPGPQADGTYRFYARWQVHDLRIVYDPNATTGWSSSTPSTGPVDYVHPITGSRNTITPRENGFLRPGYTFTGWNTCPSGTGAPFGSSIERDIANFWSVDDAHYYQRGTGIVDRTIRVPAENPNMNKDLILYAQWQINRIATVTPQANGGIFDGSPNNGPFANVPFNADVVFPTNITRTGYRLTGWAVTNAAGDTIIEGPFTTGTGRLAQELAPDLFTGNIGTIFLTAQWAALRLTITHNPNDGGTGSATSSIGYYDGTIILNNNQGTPRITRLGYTFLGWSRDSGSATPDVDLIIGDPIPFPISVNTLWDDPCTEEPQFIHTFAIWQINQLNIIFDPAGGDIVGGAPPSTPIDWSMLTTVQLPDSTRGFDSFGGWLIGGKVFAPDTWYSPRYLVPALDLGNQTVTAVAQWTIHRITQINFDYNGGEEGDYYVEGGPRNNPGQGGIGANQIITFSTGLIKDGYQLRHWVSDEVCTAECKEVCDNVAHHFHGSGTTALALAPGLISSTIPLVTLTAIWSPNHINVINFNFDGGTVVTPLDHAGREDDVELHTTVTFPILRRGDFEIVRQWHLTDAWGSRIPGIEPFATSALAEVLAPALRYGDVNGIWLKADWQPTRIETINFSPGEGGSWVGGSPPPWLPYTNVLHSSPVQFQTAHVTRPNSRVHGWAVTDESGNIIRGPFITGSAIASALEPDLISGDVSSITLTAIWRDVNIGTVIFDNGGGSWVGGAPSSLTAVSWNSSIIFPTNLTRPGYTLVGWTSTATGTFEHQLPSATAFTLAPNLLTDGDVTWIILTAVWKAHVLTITFNPDGGTPNFGTIQLNYEDSINFGFGTFPSPTRHGYTFDGWTGGDIVNWRTGHRTARQILGDLDNGDLQVTLVAQWIPITFNITFNFRREHGIENAPPNPIVNPNQLSYVFGQGISLEDAIPPHGTDAVFAGWWTARTGGVKMDVISSTHYGNVTLYARWVHIDTTRVRIQFVTTHPDGIIVNNPNGDLVIVALGNRYDLLTPIVPASSDSRYVFAGWFDANGNRVTFIQADEAGLIVLTARWQVPSGISGATIALIIGILIFIIAAAILLMLIIMRNRRKAKNVQGG